LNLLTKSQRTLADLCVALAIAFLFAVLNFSINFIGTVHKWLDSYSRYNIAAWIINILFFWLAVLLWIAYLRWRNAVKRSTELQNIISSISPDALLVATPEREIIMCNESIKNVLGYTVEEVLNKKTEMLYYDRRTSKGQRREIYNVLQDEGFHVGMATGKRKDGREIPLEIITGSLSGRSGAVLLLRDISERIKAEEENRKLTTKMLQQQKLESLGILAGGVAHDFNNLLMVILGNAELAIEDLPPASPAREGLTGIKNAAHRAGELCKQMLAYSGKGEFVVEPLNLSEAVEGMGRLMEVSIAKKAALRYDLDPKAPLIKCDNIQIHQVIMNLITNASDAIDDDEGVISVRTGVRNIEDPSEVSLYLDEKLEPGKYVYLEVADTGCGMDEETRAKIFDPFFTTKFTGRGLGLAAVLGIIRSHGGAITVESREGQGATFTVFFPAMVQTSSIIGANAAASKWQGEGKALLVDNDDSVRMITGRMLARMGFTVVETSSGGNALEILKKEDNIRLVMLDMEMPGLPGNDTLKEIRSIDRNVPVLISSGFMTDEAADALPKADEKTAFISKPYSVTALRNKIRHAFGGKRTS